MAKLARRFYLNPFTRFDVYESGIVVMHYMGSEVKRRKIVEASNLRIQRAFLPELGPLATGVPLPMPTVPAGEEVELGEARPTSTALKRIEERLTEIEKEIRRMKRKPI